MRTVEDSASVTIQGKEYNHLKACEKHLSILRSLCGYVENGTNTVVHITQDDATKDWVLTVGNPQRELVFSNTFLGLFDMAKVLIKEDY